MAADKYRFYLRSANGSSFDWYYYNGSSINWSTSTTPINPIGFAPDGWENIVISAERDTKYSGVLLNYTEPLSFIQDAATIVRYFYFNYGTNAKLQLYVEKYNYTASVNNYQFFFVGDLDFSTYLSEKDKATCTIIEGGFTSKLLARENTNYDINISSDTQRVKVLLDGFWQRQSINWTLAKEPVNSSGSASFGTTTIHSGQKVVPTCLKITEDGFNNGECFYGETTEFVIANALDNGFSSLAGSLGTAWDAHITTNGGSKKIEITFKANNVGFANLGSSSASLRLIARSFFGTSHVIWTGTAVAAGGSILDNPNVTVTINTANPQDVIYFEFISTANDDFKISLQLGDIIAIAYNTAAPTYVECLKSNRVFSKLIDSISDTETSSDSTLLDDNEDILLTSGNALRRLATFGLKTNISDFYKSWNAQLGIAMWYDRAANICRLENKNVVYDQTTSIELGEVSNFKIKPNTQELFSKLKAGYPNSSYDQINGKDEYNKQHEYLLPFTRVQTEKDYTSVYRADCYGIEQVRSEYLNVDYADSADNKDNDVFFIHADLSTPYTDAIEGTYYKLKRYPSMTISNIINTDLAYNIYLTPKRMIRRNGSYLASVMHLITEAIKHQTTSKDTANGLNLITVDGGVTIDEVADLTGLDFAAPLFYPIIFEFDKNEPNDIHTAITTNPFEHIKFSYKGFDYYGFIKKVSTNPSFQKTQQFELICSPTTDINNLIY